MILFWIVAGLTLAGIVFGTWLLVANNIEDGLSFIVFSPLVAGIFLVFTSFVVGVSTTNEVTETRSLRAIGNGKDIDASYTSVFFIAHGSYDEENVYYYFSEDQGGYRLNHIYVEEAIIIETDGEPHLEYKCDRIHRGNWNPIFSWRECSDEWDVKFYVPKGSLTTTMKIDLPAS